MKKVFVFWAMALAFQAKVSAADLDSDIQAKAVLLLDANSGEVLYSRRADTPYPPASTVKLMTALLVWEKTGLNGTVTVFPADTNVEPSHVPLRVGEQVSVRDLTSALLIGSDNDTAMALGRHVGGSVDGFVRMMNARAVQLGCTNTVFKNPNGLPASGQVSTASDMMKIFRAVLAIPELRDICSTKYFTLTTAVGTQRVKNHNKLLGVYPGMEAAKTGWTYASRHTYAACVRRDGHVLLLTILNSPNKWTDAQELFDFGLARASGPSAPVYAAQSTAPSTASAVTYRVSRGDTLYAIARRYGLTTQDIVACNDMANPNDLRPGQIIKIPAR